MVDSNRSHWSISGSGHRSMSHTRTSPTGVAASVGCFTCSGLPWKGERCSRTRSAAHNLNGKTVSPSGHVRHCASVPLRNSFYSGRPRSKKCRRSRSRSHFGTYC